MYAIKMFSLCRFTRKACIVNKLIVVSVALLSMSGCTAPKYNYVPSVTKSISEPPLESVNTSYVGERLLSQGIYAEKDVLKVDSPISVSWSYDVGVGEYHKTGEDAESDFFLAMGPGVQTGVVTKAALSDPAVSVQAFKNKKKLCVITVFNASNCTDDASYTITSKPTVTADTFQQTLIYSGKVGNIINIGYREFDQNLARASFSNDVQYDLSDSNIIGYKGARLEVVEATNQYIKYKVLKNFN